VGKIGIEEKGKAALRSRVHILRAEGEALPMKWAKEAKD